jgi:hypothetical protein
LNIEKISAPRSDGTPTPLSRKLNSQVVSRAVGRDCHAGRLVGVEFEPVCDEVLKHAGAVGANDRQLSEVDVTAQIVVAFVSEAATSATSTWVSKGSVASVMPERAYSRIPSTRLRARACV